MTTVPLRLSVAAILLAGVFGKSSRAGPIFPALSKFDRILTRVVDQPDTFLRKVKDLSELRQAFENFQSRDYDRCLELLGNAREKYPQLPPARLMLVRFFLSQNQVPRAVLEQAAVDAPQYPGTYLTFGELALAEGRLADATLHFEKALQLATIERWPIKQRNHFHFQSRSGLSTIAARRGEWVSAKAHLSAWLKLDPDNAKTRQRLGQALFNLKEYDDAYNQLQRAAKADLSLEAAAVTMGLLYTQQGDVESAAKWMERAVKLSPKSPKVRLAMVRWLLEQGKIEHAKQHSDVARRLGGDSNEYHLLCGLIARYLKEYSQATKHFEVVYRKNPADFQASNQLALVLVEQSEEAKRKRALQLAEVNWRQYPKSAEVLSTLGQVYYRLGRLDAAERALQAVVADGKKVSGETAYFLARVLLDRDRRDDARELLKSALKTRRIFAFREEAQDLLDRLTKESQ